ncbi:MAG: hypothetical protein ACLFSZ_11160 [Puniceicoccaceae bacterium]
MPVAQPSWDVNLAADLYPFNRIYNSPLPAYGLYLAHAEDILLSDIELRPAEDDPRPALGYQNVTNIMFIDRGCSSKRILTSDVR